MLSVHPENSAAIETVQTAIFNLVLYDAEPDNQEQVHHLQGGGGIAGITQMLVHKHGCTCCSYLLPIEAGCMNRLGV